MAHESTEPVWLTDDHLLSVSELSEMSGLSEAELLELVDYGAVTPVDPESSPWMFTGRCLLTVRTACRLRISFDLEPHGVALMVSLLERIRGLESQLDSLRARLPRQP